MTDDECRQIYTDAMELPNRNAVSVMRYIVAAHTEKLLAGVEMPERYDCVRDIERNVTEDVFTESQLQAYAAAAALNARIQALKKAKGVCLEYDDTWYEYRKGAQQCAAAIEALNSEAKRDYQTFYYTKEQP